LEVIVQGMQSSLCVSRTAIVTPPARTARRVFGFGVVAVCSSAWKRWTQRSQFTGIPRNPSQMPTNVAACEIAFGAKLCSSTL
jgi:hypothetical protein